MSCLDYFLSIFILFPLPYVGLLDSRLGVLTTEAPELMLVLLLLIKTGVGVLVSGTVASIPI